MDVLPLVAIAGIVVATVYAFARKALLSLTYAIAVMFVFFLQVLSVRGLFGADFLSPVVQELGLLLVPGRTPDPWTWVTFQFVHGSPSHLLLNLLGFVLISPLLEERIGRSAWLLLFLAGGAFGAGVSLALHLNEARLLIGASAGLFSLFGAYGRLYPRERVQLFLPIPGVPSLRAFEVVLGFLVLETVLGILGPEGIAWEAHVGGLVFGLAAAPFVRRLPSRRREPKGLIPLDGLRALATTPDLQGILREAASADLPELREAWIEKFVRAARCPRCAGPLRVRWGRISSACGWSQRLG